MSRHTRGDDSRPPTLAELHLRYKVTYANARGPYPVPLERSTVAMGLVTGLIALCLIARAPVWGALSIEAALVTLPLAPERLREQWTWAAWLGAVGAGSAGAGGVVAQHLGSSNLADGAGALTALAFCAVFCWRHAGRRSPGQRQFRLVVLVGVVLGLSVLAVLSANAW